MKLREQVKGDVYNRAIILEDIYLNFTPGEVFDVNQKIVYAEYDEENNEEVLVFNWEVALFKLPLAELTHLYNLLYINKKLKLDSLSKEDVILDAMVRDREVLNIGVIPNEEAGAFMDKLREKIKKKKEGL